jgi:hypothetical protein
MNEFVKYAPRELFIDPAEIFVKYIKDDLSKKQLLNEKNFPAKEEFYVSSNPQEFVRNGRIFYMVKELPTVV